MTASATQPFAYELELLVADAGGPEVLLDAAVSPLDLGEHTEHRVGGRRGDPTDPPALRFGARLPDPRLLPRSPSLPAEGVVGGDLRVVDARDVQQQRDEHARPVLAAHAVHHDAAVPRVRDGGE